jgi:BlaI family transcriptional regulator, penicillinase repressor
MDVADPLFSTKRLIPKPTKDLRRREHAMFLTIQELELMSIIWNLGEASVAQVKEAYQADRNLAYTTIMTILSRLEKKGMLKQRKAGKAFFYSAVHSREEVAEAAIDNLSRIFFGGSRESLVQFCQGSETPSAPAQHPLISRKSMDEILL